MLVVLHVQAINLVADLCYIGHRPKTFLPWVANKFGEDLAGLALNTVEAVAAWVGGEWGKPGGPLAAAEPGQATVHSMQEQLQVVPQVRSFIEVLACQEVSKSQYYNPRSTTEELVQHLVSGVVYGGSAQLYLEAVVNGTLPERSQDTIMGAEEVGALDRWGGSAAWLVPTAASLSPH
jgi:hypothetical protein